MTLYHWRRIRTRDLTNSRLRSTSGQYQAWYLSNPSRFPLVANHSYSASIGATDALPQRFLIQHSSKITSRAYPSMNHVTVQRKEHNRQLVFCDRDKLGADCRCVSMYFPDFKSPSFPPNIRQPCGPCRPWWS